MLQHPHLLFRERLVLSGVIAVRNFSRTNAHAEP